MFENYIAATTYEITRKRQFCLYSTEKLADFYQIKK